MAMIRQLIRLQPYIEKALKELHDEHLYDQSLFIFLSNLLEVLEPLETAILYIGRTKVNLIEADAALKYVFASLEKCQNPLSIDLIATLREEISKRRNKDVISLMKFLQTKSWEFLKDSTDIFDYASKTQIQRKANELYHDLTGEEVSDDELLSSGEFDAPKESPTPGSLMSFIAKEMTIEPDSSPTFSIKNEFNLSITNKRLTSKLEFMYNALCTIQPSSISCEQAFSVASNFLPKDRNGMGNDLFNALNFLKYDFIKKEGKSMDISKKQRVE